MFVQVGLEGKGLVAARAGVRLRVGVGLDVGAEVGLVGERLVANVALERFFPWNIKKRFVSFRMHLERQILCFYLCVF